MTNMPLQGIRILDLSHSWAVPHCGRVLADFGAEVIKVEYVKRMCLLRGPFKVDKAYDNHPAWFHVNRNKLSITLDLNDEKDRNTLIDLIKHSDILIENSRTGVMDRLGFGYRDLIKIKEDLIMLSMSAFGHTGPYAFYAGYGAVFESVGGIQSLTAYESEGKSERVKEMDVINGIAGACAVMTALVYRQRTGKGQHIDLSQLEAATHATIGEHLLEYGMNRKQTLPLGNRHWKFAPQGCYRCKGEDKWVVITIRSEEEWQRFCEVLEDPKLVSDPRFATKEARHKYHDELDSVIESWTSSLSHYEAMHTLQQAGIASGAVLNVQEISADPHLKERGYFVPVESDSDKLSMGMPFELSEGVGKIRWGGPALGQHNKYVLCRLLGRSQDELKPILEEEIGTAFEPSDK